MIRLGLSYGVLSTRRRMRAMILPIVTTATGAFLVVLVMALSGAVDAQAQALGNGSELHRAIVLIAVVVLLVGVVEVAICSTRTIATRTREIGVLGATGVGRAPVVGALLVEPFVTSVAGAAIGAAIGVVASIVFVAVGFTDSTVSGTGAAAGVVLAILVSAVAAMVTSAFPTWRAASQPPIRSLSSGG
jgi:ABC-type antimicrobial peptide transport system permease subunit